MMIKKSFTSTEDKNKIHLETFEMFMFMKIEIDVSITFKIQRRKLVQYRSSGWSYLLNEWSNCSKKSSIHEFTADRRPFRKSTSNAAIYEYKIYKKNEKVVYNLDRI